MELKDLRAGLYVLRGEEGYEEARRSLVWHQGVPDRFPAVIVKAVDEDDVVRAVRAAREADLKIAVRSGGRSWSANHLRDGAMVIDLSDLRAMTIDRASMRGTAQPGLWAADFLKELTANDLFFPGGHCVGVALGGYLLQGGYGWSGRVYGPACGSVEAIDVVTADGELVRADQTQNKDLLWAARGAGPGFFGVVTRFHVRLYPLAKAIGWAMYRYPADAIGEVLPWLQSIGPELAPQVEVHTAVARNEAGVAEIAVTAQVFASSEAEAIEMLSPLQNCPVRNRALSELPYQAMTFDQLLDLFPALKWVPYRWNADNLWVNAPVKQVMPSIRRIIEELPPAPSFFYWMLWARKFPKDPKADMAFDLQESQSIGLYTATTDAAEHETRADWLAARMRELEAVSSGTQLADENLGRRPVRFVSDEHLARLDEIRATRDPQQRFHSWIGRPW